jgi:hypothetical protein
VRQLARRSPAGCLGFDRRSPKWAKFPNAPQARSSLSPPAAPAVSRRTPRQPGTCLQGPKIRYNCSIAPVVQRIEQGTPNNVGLRRGNRADESSQIRRNLQRTSLQGNSEPSHVSLWALPPRADSARVEGVETRRLPPKAEKPWRRYSPGSWETSTNREGSDVGSIPAGGTRNPMTSPTSWDFLFLTGFFRPIYTNLKFTIPAKNA